MTNSIENITELTQELKALSDHIDDLKRNTNVMEPGPDRYQLRQDIKMNKYQALFYKE